MCQIASVEKHDQGPIALDHGQCVLDLGAMVLEAWIHSVSVLFGGHLYSRTKFKLNVGAALADFYQLLGT